jgi:hypothetical protein
VHPHGLEAHVHGTSSQVSVMRDYFATNSMHLTWHGTTTAG